MPISFCEINGRENRLSHRIVQTHRYPVTRRKFILITGIAFVVIVCVLWNNKGGFYGKVVDDDNQPVAGARIQFEWSGIGAVLALIHNASDRGVHAETSSNRNGLFSLTRTLNAGGLLVHVEKAGYYTVERGGAAVPFEYADPSASDYYKPKASKPVIFHLRKKGAGAKLINKAVDLSLPANKTARLDLIVGHITPDGSLQIQPNKPDRQAMRGRYAWSVTLSMTDGGLIETNDQFPFLAPENGYVSTMVMDMTDTSGPTWRNSLTKSYYFYFSSTNTYGRMTVYTLGGTSHVYLDYLYNPTPGDHNLEPASK